MKDYPFFLSKVVYSLKIKLFKIDTIIIELIIKYNGAISFGLFDHHKVCNTK